MDDELCFDVEATGDDELHYDLAAELKAAAEFLERYPISGDARRSALATRRASELLVAIAEEVEMRRIYHQRATMAHPRQIRDILAEDIPEGPPGLRIAASDNEYYVYKITPRAILTARPAPDRRRLTDLVFSEMSILSREKAGRVGHSGGPNMSIATDRPDFAGLGHGLGELRGEWIWFVALGVVLILLGTVVLGSVVVASLAVAVVIGALILIGGVAESIGAFWCRRWSGFFLHLLSGVLSIVIGLLFLRQPVGALAALTLLTAVFLLVGGAFKIAASASMRFESWGWPLLGGLIDVALGVMILMDYPASALWVLGMFLGISMVFRGVNWVGIGLALRSLPAPAGG